jgi:hypothetical protein
MLEITLESIWTKFASFQNLSKMIDNTPLSKVHVILISLLIVVHQLT